jgi:hypothetical protein
VLLLAVIPALRWPIWMRALGLLMYVVGLAPAILLQAQLNKPITGDLLPVAWHPELVTQTTAQVNPNDDDDGPKTSAIWQLLTRLGDTTFGNHGAFSHFPILIFGMLGIAAVMHRHWPLTTKILATATGITGAAIVAMCSVRENFGTGSMFATRWFIVFLPLLLFWGGALIRRPHHPIMWSLAAVLLIFSIAVSLIGGFDPLPREGYDRYTAAAALSKLMQPEPTFRPTYLAGR